MIPTSKTRIRCSAGYFRYSPPGADYKLLSLSKQDLDSEKPRLPVKPLRLEIGLAA